MSWSDSIGEPDIGGKHLVQDRDDEIVERIGLLLKKHWLDLVT